MRNTIWYALSHIGFDPSQFLYHYTNFEAALKIIYYNKFRFSPLSHTNDTTEQKVRILYDFPVDESVRSDCELLEETWKRWMENSKLLCFSQDEQNSECVTTANRFDSTGRGFALPRMWAQYTQNAGICFVIDKDSFLADVKRTFPMAICQEVHYCGSGQILKMSHDTFDEATMIIRHKAPDIITNILPSELIDYLYFTKVLDWAGEHEFRVLIPDSESKTNYLEIENVRKYIKGIVFGESCDDSKIYAINEITPATIAKRKIAFKMSQCSLENVSDI